MELILIRVGWILICFLALVNFRATDTLAEEDISANEVERHKWFLTAYGGAHAQDDFNDVVTLQPKFEDNAYIGVLALGREFWHYKKYLSFELEGQVAKHFNKDTHWEFVGVLIGRWNYFPWDKYVDTSFAVGDGISYYTEVSEVEEDDTDDDAQRALNYLLLEFTFGLPDYPKWDLVLRLHHRSSVFGLAGEGGSNFVCGGFKLAF
jgi:hypothetical protein